ncbi:hypothetical protein ABIE00_002497 [Arthrobacter sp. OAP107]
MLGRAHVLMEGQEPARQSDDIISVVSRRGSRPANGSRIGWMIAGIVAVAVTLTVVVREVLNRTGDPDVERTGVEAAADALAGPREHVIHRPPAGAFLSRHRRRGAG